MKILSNKTYEKIIKNLPNLRSIDKIRGIERSLRYDYLYDTVKKKKCKKIMEIGVYKGERAIRMIRTAQTFCTPNEIEYYGFDLFEMMNDEIFKQEVSKKPFTLEQVKSKLEKTGSQITLFRGFTEKTLPEALPSLPIMDLVFIDGGHSIETIKNDWYWTQQIMDNNTIVIFDDYWSGEWGARTDAGCQSIINNLDPTEFDVKILPIQDSYKKEWGVLKINFVKVKCKSKF